MDDEAFSGQGDDSRVLRQVIEAAPNAMVMVDREGRITLVNTETERLFGHSREELLAMTLEQLIPERFRSRHTGFRDGFFLRPDTRAMGAGRNLFGRHSDGHEFPIEIGLNPVEIGERVQVLASIIDITERKRSEERLNHVVEAAPNAMIMVNASGEIVLVNSQTERSFGYSRTELLRMRVEDLIPERFTSRHNAYREGYFRGPDRREMGVGRDLFGRRKDGTEIPIEIGLNPIQVLDEQHVLASIIDITERLALQDAESADRSDRLRRSILDSLPWSIIASDSTGTIVTANPAAGRLLGIDREDLVGVKIDDLRESDSASRQSSTRGQSVGEREVEYRRPDGSTVPVNEVIAHIAGEDGDVDGFLSVAYDITQRREAESVIWHMAHYDSLTDLPNRTMLFDRLDMEIEAAKTTKQGLAVVLLDLDHFKRVNDSLGHHIGDELLLEMARRLRSQVRDVDLVARLGGDEFVLVLTDVSSPSQLDGRIAKLLEALPEPMLCNGHELLTTASMGGALFPADGGDPVTLLRHADTAMYHAKATARNTFQWFDESMLDETNDKLALAAALRHALDSDEIYVSYQPQICLRTGDVVGIEALARWRTADGRSVPPDRFIPVAEDNGLIIRLGELILRKACEDTKAMSEALGRPLRLAVNVSPRQLRGKGWLAVLEQALEDSDFPAEQLELEITEGIFMDDLREVVGVLDAVRALGVAIVIDDFGTGFSSLAYLTRFPIDKIKIDRSFVSNFAVNQADAAIVDTIIVMAHTLGMTVVAEGVETLEQETYLRERGCDEVQGFYYSTAISAANLLAFVGSRV